MVYAIPEGTLLPDDLILVHEHTDHYSLQPAVEMDLKDLNKKITRFLEEKGVAYTREQWIATFEDQSDCPAGPSSNFGSTGQQWMWSEEYSNYYYYKQDGEIVWAPVSEEQHQGGSRKKNKRR